MTHHKKKLLTAAYIGGLLQPKNPHIISYKRRRNNNNLGPSLLFAIDDKDDITSGIAYNNGGSYVDLGTITAPFNDEAAKSLLQNYQWVLSTKSASYPSSSQQLATTSNNIHSSNHWIVLIDDEPSIRLAIGDYLHSMGYTMITACDGPQSFLDVLLYSCGWSLIVDSNNVGTAGAGGNNCPPPWMSDSGDDESTMMLWRLPNCIISDIRMPGGVDGVQLLELLRRSKDDNNNNRRSSNSEDDDSSGDDDVKEKGKKKNKGRRSKKGEATERSNNEYDGKDDFELLDAIVGNGGVSNNDGSSSSSGTTTRKQQRQQEAGKIVTAIDQAIQKLDVISDTLIYHQKKVRCNSNSPSLQLRQQEQQQYPTTLAQIPVILLTAKAMVSDRIVGFKAGANNYLPKPFRPEELLGMVDSLLRKQERERKEWIVSDDLLMGSSSDDDIVATVKQQQQHNSDEEVKYVDEELVESYYSASAQQVKDLTTELIEIKNLLKEEAQRQTNAKAEQEEVGRLTKLLPEALWMFMNDERRKRLFTTDHIRSILIFCFDDTALARKSIVKRDDLLAELERRNDENPDLVQDFLLD
jgi:DNA-binding response OmpR family regulator